MSFCGGGLQTNIGHRGAAPPCRTGRYELKFSPQFKGAQPKLAATTSKPAAARFLLFPDYAAGDARAGIPCWISFVVVSRGVDYDRGAAGLK